MDDKIKLNITPKTTKDSMGIAHRNIDVKLTVPDSPPSINSIFHKITKEYMKEFYNSFLSSEINNYPSDEELAYDKEPPLSFRSEEEREQYIKQLLDKSQNAWKDVHIFDVDDKFSWENRMSPAFDYTRFELVQKFSEEISSSILYRIEYYISTNHIFRTSMRKFTVPNKLTPDCIVQILLSTDIFGRFELSNNTYLLGMYQTYGPDKGIYRLLESEDDYLPVYEALYHFDPGLKKAECEEIKHKLLVSAEQLEECSDDNLTAVGNGIWDFKNQCFIDYDNIQSRFYIFTKKIHTNYNPFAQNIIIHREATKEDKSDAYDWDVESWIQEFFENNHEKDKDKIEINIEMTNLLWCIIHAFCRPNVDYKRTIWFGNPSGDGNNGKGTFTAFLRNLLGRSVCKSLNLKGFCENFALGGITHWIGIIADENSFQGTVEDVSTYKCIVTRDPVNVNVKFGKPYDYIYKGMTLQCFNEYPCIGDKSGSFARRLLLVNFEKSFSVIKEDGTGETIEKPEIKDDYIERKEVLEYALKKVLTMDIRKLPEPEPVRLANSKFVYDTVPYKLFVKEFLLPSERIAENKETNFSPQLKWRRMPIAFVYDLYCEWHKKNYQRRPYETSAAFKNRLVADSSLFNIWDVTLNRETWRKDDIVDPQKAAAAKERAKEKKRAAKLAREKANNEQDNKVTVSINDNGNEPFEKKTIAVKVSKTTLDSNEEDNNIFVIEPLINAYNLRDWKGFKKNQLSQRYYGFITNAEYDTYYDTYK